MKKYRNREQDHWKGSNHSEDYSMLILRLPEKQNKVNNGEIDDSSEIIFTE